MSRSLLTVPLLVQCVVSTTALVPFWKPCPLGPEPEWSQCSFEAMQEAYPHLIDGNPEYNLPVMDPLHEDKFVIHKGSDLVGFTIEVTNATITGLGNSSVHSYTIDLKGGKGEVGLDIPQLNLTGRYVLSGKILTLYANGSGDTHMTLDNIKGTLKAEFDKFKSESRDGIEHEYYNITKVSLGLDVQDARMQFNNLYNGNKKLESQANNFLSRHWRELYKFLGPAFNRAVGEAFKRTAENAMEFLPLDELYPPGKERAGTTENSDMSTTTTLP